MIRRHSIHLALLICLTVFAGACGSSDSGTTPTPVPTPPTTVTETFEGTINRNGAATYPFTNTAASNVITATLTVINPEGTTIGLSLGTCNGQVCQIVLANDSAVQGTAVIGATTAQGNLCVRVYDVGQLTGQASYTVEVVHQ